MAQLNSEGQGLTWGKNATSLSIVTAIFLLWGLVTVLNGLFSNSLLTACDLPVKFLDPFPPEELNKELGEFMLFRKNMLSFVFFGTFLVFAYPAGKLVKKIGYKNGMVSGLGAAAIGSMSIICAALIGDFTLLLIANSILAAGITFLQVAANPYVLFVSKPNVAASRLTFVQAFNSMGTFIAPAIVSVFAISTIDDVITCCQDINVIKVVNQHVSANEVVFPYMFLAGLLMIAAIVVTVSNLPGASAVHLEGEPDENRKKSAWHYPHVIFAAVAIFAYVGAEVVISTNLTNYWNEVKVATETLTGEPYDLPFSASWLIYIYFAGAILGRLIGSYLLKTMESHNLMTLFAVSAAMLVFVAFSGHNMIAVFCLASVGFFNSILFPTIFSLGIRGLGKHSEEGSSIMIMAISGGGLVPFLFSFYHDRMELIHELGSDKYHHTNYDGALWVPFICYMTIVFYGLFGYRFRRKDSVHFEGTEDQK